MADGSAQTDHIRGESISIAAERALQELDPKKIFAFLRRRLNVIAGITILFTSLGALVTFQTTPLYTASVDVMIDPRNDNILNLDAAISGLNSGTDQIDTQVELIKSKKLAERVVEDLNLLEDPDFNFTLKDRHLEEYNPLDLLRQFLAGSSGDDAELTAKREVPEERIMGFATFKLRSTINVLRKGRTYIISIFVTTEDAEKSALIADAVAAAYLDEQLEAKFDSIERANSWLSVRIDELRQQVRESENKVEAFRAENNLLDANGALLAESQLAELNAQLVLTKADLTEREARLARIERLIRNGSSIDAVAEVLDSQAVRSLKAEQSDILRRRADLSSRYGDRHPEMIKVRRELSDIQEQISFEVARIADSLRNEVAVTRDRENSLQRNVDLISVETSQNNRALVQLREYEREADANRALYENFLNRFKETTEQQELKSSDARVISPASQPGGPSHPKVKMQIMMAFMMSLTMGVGIALLLDWMDNGFHTADQLESKLGLVHLASVPWLDRATAKVAGRILTPQDYLLAKPLSAFAEALRFLRTSIILSDVDRTPRTILFTSAVPDEGKTTAALCFARSAAMSGMRTVLIDGDLRHPSVRSELNLDADVGLIEYLAGEAQLEETIIQDVDTDLHIIPTVRNAAATPPDMLGSEAVKSLLRRLSGEYDLVVVDSAPVLPVAATKALAQIVDKTVFVVRWHVTPTDAAKAAVKELRALHVDLAGVVMTQVDVRKQSRHTYSPSTYTNYGRYYAD